MRYSDWKEINLNVSEVLLDYDNPRVFIEEPTQDNLLRFLINEDESIELAKQINLRKGLPPAEKPVVIFENGYYVVLEGNRRISACKILLNPTSLNEEESKRFPKIDAEMKEYLENFPVVLAPDRDSTEAFITMRHSGEKGIKKWSTIATTKRFVNRYRKGESINHIARVLNETPSTVRKGIRFFYFLEFVRNEIEWTEQEKKKLEIYKMETTKLDRFLPFSKRAKDVLGVDFAPDQKIITTLPLENFKAAIKIIIRRIFVDDEIDTRSKIDEVFNLEIIDLCNTSNKGQISEQVCATNNDMRNTVDGNITEVKEDETLSEKVEISLENGITEYNKNSPNHPSSDYVADFEDEKEEAKKKPIRAAMDTETYTYLHSAYPFTNRYQKNKRINTLLKELKNNKYKENKMSSMYLIRSLLETYTHEYLDHFIKQEKNELKIKGVARQRDKRSEIRELLYNNIKTHIKNIFPQFAEEIILLDVAFTENNNTPSTKILNFYIHSQTQVPDSDELLDAWKKISTILKCLDEILHENQ